MEKISHIISRYNLIDKINKLIEEVSSSGGIKITVNINNTYEEPVENAFYVIKKDGTVQSFNISADKKSTFIFNDVVAVGQNSQDYSITVINGVSFEHKDEHNDRTYQAFISNGTVLIEFVM